MSENFLSRNMILQSQFPGTTDDCGNRIHGVRLHVANIPKLFKCNNNQRTSWWQKNYEAKTIIVTHVCFCLPLTRDAPLQEIRAAEKEVIPSVATTFTLLYVRVFCCCFFFFLICHPQKWNPVICRGCLVFSSRVVVNWLNQIKQAMTIHPRKQTPPY